jgi:5-methylcytosine-specific restriction enzyme A
MALMKFCGCGAMIPRSQAGCDRCMARWAEREATRQKEYDQKVRNRKDYTWVYKDKRWLSVRAEALLRDEYMCVRCRKNGIDKLADMVHHIIPISECVSKAFDLDNLMSLCDGEDGCHDKEHMAIRKRYKQRIK